jgi:iron complex transport system substrate-binding protein
MRIGVLILLVTASACADRAPAPGATRRVVSLHDVTTEMVVGLGAADRLVGIAEPIDVDGETAAAVRAVPRVEGLESILMARPDLVLGLGVVAEQDPELVARLRQAGIEVFLADPVVLDDVYALVGTIASRIDADGARLIEQLRLADETVAAPPDPRRVFVYDCCDPPFTAGGRTVLSDLIARAGGRNVFAAVDADWTHVSWEEVVARRPELIVVDAYRHEGQGDVADKQRAIRGIPSLERVPIVVLPLGCALGGLRSLEGLARLRAAIGAPS